MVKKPGLSSSTSTRDFSVGAAGSTDHAAIPSVLTKTGDNFTSNSHWAENAPVTANQMGKQSKRVSASKAVKSIDFLTIFIF